MKVGLIGTGWWALGTPGPALASSDIADLVGVWGRDPARTTAAAHALDCPAVADLDVLLDTADALAFAVPADVQLALAKRAVQRGLHLMLEKPLAFSVSDADDLLDAVESAGVASLVFHTDTYRPELDHSRGVLEAGSWFGARATIFVSVLEPGGVLLDSAWRVERGALWDAGPHAVSPLIETLGPVSEVTALEGPRGTVHALLRHGTTASSTVTTTLRAPAAAQAWELSWYGEQGWHHRPAGDTPSPEAYRHAIADLRQAAAGGTATRSTVAHAREVVAVIDAVQAALDDPGAAQAVHQRRP